MAPSDMSGYDLAYGPWPPAVRRRVPGEWDDPTFAAVDNVVDWVRRLNNPPHPHAVHEHLAVADEWLAGRCQRYWIAGNLHPDAIDQREIMGVLERDGPMAEDDLLDAVSLPKGRARTVINGMADLSWVRPKWHLIDLEIVELWEMTRLGTRVAKLTDRELAGGIPLPDFEDELAAISTMQRAADRDAGRIAALHRREYLELASEAQRRQQARLHDGRRRFLAAAAAEHKREETERRRDREAEEHAQRETRNGIRYARTLIRTSEGPTTTAQSQRLARFDEILEAALDLPEWFSVGQLAAQTGQPYNTAFRRIGSMRLYGLAENEKRGGKQWWRVSHVGDRATG